MKATERRHESKAAASPKVRRVRAKGDPTDSEKRILQMAKEQGVDLKGQWRRVYGKGADVWKSDAEFQEFLAYIEKGRREGRE